MGETPSQQDTGGGGAMEPVSTLAAAPLSALSAALLVQQLPNIPNFNGKNLEGDGESFGDWLERLELVACAGRWDDQTKLVNFSTRLRGTASRFYCTCTPKQKSSYQDLVKAFCSRFTPVQLQSVHSSTFHERKQRTDETVDNYAQELCKLFSHAYPAASGSEEAETMGKSVLSNQFVSGLGDPLKAKMLGRSGMFEELLAKARFEEARLSTSRKEDKLCKLLAGDWMLVHQSRTVERIYQADPFVNQSHLKGMGVSLVVVLDTLPGSAPAVDEEPQQKPRARWGHHLPKCHMSL